MAASLQPRMFAKGAMESIGVDNGDWVASHLRSDNQVYRANLATSILRSAMESREAPAGSRRRANRQTGLRIKASQGAQGNCNTKEPIPRKPDLMALQGGHKRRNLVQKQGAGNHRVRMDGHRRQDRGDHLENVQEDRAVTSGTFAIEIERMANGRQRLGARENREDDAGHA